MKIHYYFDIFTVINSIDCQLIQNSVLLEELTDFKDLMKAEISYINLKHNEVIQEKEKEILSIKTELSLVQFNFKNNFSNIYKFLTLLEFNLNKNNFFKNFYCLTFSL
jgi:hypothetical protein